MTRTLNLRQLHQLRVLLQQLCELHAGLVERGAKQSHAPAPVQTSPVRSRRSKSKLWG